VFDNRGVQVDAVEQQGYAVTTRRGFEALYDDALPVVFNSMMRLTGGDRPASEDLTQDAFGELVKAVQSGKLTYADIGWLVTAARRRYIDRVRRSAVEQRVLALVAAGHEDAVEPSWERFDAPTVLDLCHALPADQRIALILRHVDGLSVPAIAAEIGRSVHAIESLLARARRTLRETAKEQS
jgi:RNA polymerase sigma-70 factor, ECF subfamily